MNDRGVASPVGVVLVLGISLVAILAMLSVGAAVIDDARNDAETSQMENAISQFSSKASLVGLGESSHQRFALGRAASGSVEIREDAGQVSLFAVPSGENLTDTEPIYDESYGSVVYHNGDTEVAYQGGGVWRGYENASRMVSPPEFHYRSRTLTFPIIRVEGDGSASGRLRGAVSSETVDAPIYPGPDHANPLDNGTVYVKIQSDYCAGWESFFEDRSEGSIEQRCEENEQRTVIVDLSIPFQESFQDEVIATEEVRSNPPRGYAGGATRSSASDMIDGRIEECIEENCSDLPDSEITDGTYYVDDDVEFNNETFNTTQGDVNIVIDGELTVDDTNELEGDGELRVFLKDDLTFLGGSSINEGGNATQLQMYVHSEAEDVTFNGNNHLTGIVYAPNTDITLNGNVVIKGAVVGEVVRIDGESNELLEDESLDDFETDLSTGQTPITYLHVTENTVEVEL